MTEEHRFACDDPMLMLQFLQESGRASDRKLRLFACACYRRKVALHAFTREVVEVVERLADGLATDDELEIAYDQAWRGPHPAPEAGWVASLSPMEAAEQSARWMAQHLSLFADPSGTLRYRQVLALNTRAQAAWLRDIFGPLPFRPVTLSPSLLKSEAVVKLAQDAYDHRHLPEGMLNRARVLALADALLEAGCKNKEVLVHLHEWDGFHVRGCWVIDLLLAKS